MESNTKSALVKGGDMGNRSYQENRDVEGGVHRKLNVEYKGERYVEEMVI